MFRGNSKRFGQPTGGPRQVVERLRLGIQPTERELRLEQHVEALKTELKEIQRDLERKSLALRTFNRIISHNLRAPLRAMHGFSTLLDSSKDQLQPAERSYIERIQGSAAKTEEILQGLLAYGSIVGGHYPMELLDPNPLMRRAIEKLQQTEHREIAPVTIDVPLPAVWANSTLLEMVFVNLLSNAFKYVTTGLAPRVVVSHERRRGNVRLSIQDRGLGLSPELRQQLFGPLHALLAFSNTGAGMGLLRVQAAADRMNARLGVESTPARGSRFWIELPENGPDTF